MAKVAVGPGLASKWAEGTKSCEAILCCGLDLRHMVVGADVDISLPPLMVFGVAAKTIAWFPDEVNVKLGPRWVHSKSAFGLRREGWDTAGSGSDA